LKIERLSWLGVRTERFEEMTTFLRDALGLDLRLSEPGRSLFLLPNGDPIDIFDTSDHSYAHFTSAPVVGFLVDDVAAARAELEARGVELVGPLSEAEGYAWAHFRAPDGNLYEIQGRAKPASR
jgi:catechol 2,3-dioxygenase-like lactoylglutathione lyase family enzyme